MKQSYIIPIICLILTACGSSSTPDIPKTTTHELLGGYEFDSQSEAIAGFYVILTRSNDGCDDDDHFSTITWPGNSASNEVSIITVVYINEEQLNSSHVLQQIKRNGLIRHYRGNMPDLRHADYTDHLDYLGLSLDDISKWKTNAYCKHLATDRFMLLPSVEGGCFDSPYFNH